MRRFNDQDSVFSDDASSNDNRSLQSMNSIGGPTSLFEKSNMVANNKLHEKRYNSTSKKNNSNPGFLAQFDELAFDNPADPVSSNSTSVRMGANGSATRAEIERKLALDGNYSKFENSQDMTYGIVNQNNFVHNNMVPYFNKGLGKGYGPNSETQQRLDNMKQRKVDRFSGSTKNIEYRPKVERRPLFNPHVGLTNIYGAPSYSPEMLSRYIPGREKRNEQLHQPVRVTPGLNIGYNQTSKKGFHDDYRVLPKTIDELRAVNNPQQSYTAPVVSGQKAVKRGIIPNMAKNNPETAFELDPRDWVKSMSYYRAPTIHGNVDAPTTNRQMTSREWYPAAKFEGSQPKPDSLREKQKVSSKENFLDPGPRNVRKEAAQGYAINYETFAPDPTMRNLTESVTRLNPANHSQQNKGVAVNYENMVPDPNMRNITENNNYLNPARNPQHNKGVAFNYVDNVPDPTMRNITQNNTRLNVPGNSQINKNYVYDKAGMIPDPTLRNLTENTTQLGGPGNGQINKNYVYDKQNMIPDPTLRNLTENTTQLGGPGNGQINKNYVYDKHNMIPDPTLRNLTENTSQLGGPNNSQQNKNYVINYNDMTPDLTLRNLTENNSHVGGPNSGVKKAYAFDYVNNVPDPTLRNLTQNNTILQAPGGQVNKSYSIDRKNAVPDATLRNLTENNTILQAPGGYANKSYSIDRVNAVPEPTLRNLTEVKSILNPASGEVQKSYARGQEWTPDATLKNLTEVNTRIGTARNENQRSYITSDSYIPDQTLKNLTEVNTRLNPTLSHTALKGNPRAFVDNILQNVSKETVLTVRDGGMPVPSNYSKIPTYEQTMVKLKEPTQVNRRLYGSMVGQRPEQCIPTMYTTIANVLPQLSNHFDTMVQSNLNKNEFINNTQNKSVEYY